MKLSSKLKIWRIKSVMRRLNRHLKFIEKCKGYIERTKNWYKEARKEYLKQLEDMTEEEREYLFGLVCYERLK